MKTSRIRSGALIVATLVAAGSIALAAPNASWAGAGSDHPACDEPNAVLGTNGPDVLTGTGDADIICGLAGDDQIDGAGGDDILIGGDGVDRITGAGGTDFCLGGDGDDQYTTCERCPTLAANTPIAFSRTGTASGDGVYRTLPNGSHQKALTHGIKPPYEHHNYEPDWSPDGSRIAFDGGRDDTVLYTMDAKGKNLKQINDVDASYTPDWSPDAATIAFEIEDESDESWDLYSVPSGGGKTSGMTRSDAGRFHPHYSPDGTLIAAEGNTENYDKRALVMSTSGRDERELLPGHVSYSPVWSPNSELIAFAGATSDVQSYNTPTDIYVATRDATDPVRLTDLPGTEDYPDWSADGRAIVFSYNVKGTHDLYSVKPDGSDLLRLTGDRSKEYEATWSPDGTEIAFVRGNYENYDLWVMDADGGNERRITNTQVNETDPQWRPRSCS